MKATRCVCLFCTTQLMTVLISVSFAGPAFDSLAEVAGSDEPCSSVIFDGVDVERSKDISMTSPRGFGVADGNSTTGTRINLVPIPTMGDNPGDSGERGQEGYKASPEYPVDTATERPIIDKALKKLTAVTTGKDLIEFFEAEGVEIRWKNLAAFGSEPNYALACPPESCDGKKVIYLNNLKTPSKDYRTLLLDKNPTFLAITIAHELTHLTDYKSIGSGFPKGTYVQLAGELNGWSSGVYVYHQLAIAGIAPAPNSNEEGYDVQMVRLDLAIRNYVNGGKRPIQAEFNRIWAIDGLLFDAYITEVTKIARKGSMSLAGVVERTYHLSSSLETPENPGIFASQTEKTLYKKFKKIRKSLDLSTAAYIKWRKEYVDPPPPSVPPSSGNDYVPGHDGDGGDDGVVDVDPGSWHPTPGSGQVDWGED